MGKENRTSLDHKEKINTLERKMRLINTKKFKEIFIEKFQICKKYNVELKRNNTEWLMKDLQKIIRKEYQD